MITKIFFYVFLRINGNKGIEFLPQTQNVSIPISLQPDGVNLKYFKLKLFDLTKFTEISKVYDVGLQR